MQENTIDIWSIIIRKLMYNYKNNLKIITYVIKSNFLMTIVENDFNVSRDFILVLIVNGFLMTQ